MTQPLFFHPNRVRRTYRGGKLLDQWKGLTDPQDCECPEEWIASVVEATNLPLMAGEGLSRLQSGALLRDEIARQPKQLLGEAHAERFGQSMALLVKMLDAAERLSIQVHPDVTTAQRLFGSVFGKTEAWYITGVRTGLSEPACIYLGFRPGITRERWQELFARQDIAGMLQAMHQIPVAPGDCFLIRGGVPHAIGAGCMLAEIQEPTDLTIRTERSTASGAPIADQLCHQGAGFERMFDCFAYDGVSLEECLLRNRLGQSGGQEQAVEQQELIGAAHTDQFAMTRYFFAGERVLDLKGQFCVVIVLSGRGSFICEDAVYPARQGESLFLPAACRRVAVHAAENTPLELLCCFPPRT